MTLLIDELIQALGDESQPLTGILLKTKIFMHQIGKAELADWVKNELGGYPDRDSVPEYRRFPAAVRGNITSIVARYTNHTLPTMHLDADFREKVTSSVITSPINTVEEWVKQDGGSLQNQIPLELNGEFNKALQSGFHVESAWTETSLASVSNILVQVRSRLLDFLLELKTEIGPVDNSDEVKKGVEKLDTATMFNHAVFGDGATITFAGMDASVSVKQTYSATELADAIKALLTQLEPLLPQAQLGVAVESQVAEAVAELRAASAEVQPDVPRMNGALGFLKRSLEGATGNLVASGAIQVIASVLASAPSA